MKSILDIKDSGLCCGCGNCTNVCQSLCISLKKDSVYQVHQIGECYNCGKCVKVCPVVNDLQLRRITHCYTAYSQNDDIRLESSSGGFVTQFLIDLLERKVINGAIVCDFSEENIFVANAVIAKTKKELIQASASKYCPVPMNAILKHVPIGTFVFVGLPCHIKALKLLQKYDKHLRESIIVSLGLFCNHTPNFKATDYLLHNLNIPKSEVSKIRYRGGGWPGICKIWLKDGNVIHVKNLWQTGFGRYFIPKSCLNCRDVFSNHADISVGDPWLNELKHEIKGQSIVVIRDDNALKLVTSSQGLSLQIISYDIVYKSQEKICDMKIERKLLFKRKFNSFLGQQKKIWKILFNLNKKFWR
jgi:coenzyme F420 hydrogenase subunit beta